MALGIKKEHNTAATIFLVEDDGIIAYSIAATLRKAGLHVAGTAASGEDAFNQIQAVCPDLVLMDIRLNGHMDGIELAAKVRQTLAVPIIFLSAHSDKETLKRAHDTGPCAYLTKPIVAEKLCTIVMFELDRHLPACKCSGMQLSLESVTSPSVDPTFDDSSIARAPALSVRSSDTDLLGSTVLVVDDDFAVRRMILASLRSSGYKVAEAESGTEALSWAEQRGENGLALLITDIIMPGISGPTLSRALASTYSGMKTLFITGFSGDVLRSSSALPEAAVVLRKPFSHRRLVSAVQAMLVKETLRRYRTSEGDVRGTTDAHRIP